MEFWQECINCGTKYDSAEILYTCRRCGDILEIKYDYAGLEAEFEGAGLWRYRCMLPIEGKRFVTLNEGRTSLFECKTLSKGAGASIFVKNEGENPTGSFKDRGMSVGVSRALELRVSATGCASTGNTSASLAAYSARAGIKCSVFIPAGKIAIGKLAQALVYGASVYAIKGNFDDAMRMVHRLALDKRIYLLNSINPYRIEGQKTIGFELCEQADDIDAVVVPVGNAANISAIWKGFKEMQMLGRMERLPRMYGVQASGSAPICNMLSEGGAFKPVENPETVATAIRIGNPVSWKKAIAAMRESGGGAFAVSDEEILGAQRLLAKSEGIFVEPASAATIACLAKLREKRLLDKAERAVCVTTGNGLKDPNAIIERLNGGVKEIRGIGEVAL